MTKEAPKWFVDALKSIAPGLDVVWSPSMEIFCIYYKNAEGKTAKIKEVCDENGKYLPLDNRTLDWLKLADQSKNPLDPYEATKRALENFYKKQLEDQKKKRENIRYKAKQMKSWWQRLAEKMLEQGNYIDDTKTPNVRQRAMQQRALMQATQGQANQQLLGQMGRPVDEQSAILL